MYKQKYLIFIVTLFFFIGAVKVNCLDVYEFTFNGKKYEIVKEKRDWNSAASVAVSRGGYLVQINSKAENDAIFSAIMNGAKISQTYTTVMDGGGVAYLWIGATDKLEEGKWFWDGDNDGVGDNFWNGQGVAGKGGGKPVSGFFVNWGGAYSNTYAEPDDFNNNQDAAAMALEPWPKGMGGLGIAGEWNDISITNSIYYIIEYDEKIGIPELINPENNSIDIERKPTFLWKSVDAEFYHLQVSLKQDFSSDIIIDESTLNDTFYIPSTEFEAGIKLFWKVNASKGTKIGDWSEVWNFTVKDIPPPAKPTLVSPANNSKRVDTLPKFIWNKVDADWYHLKVSLTEDFSSGIIIDKENIKDTSYQATSKFEPGKTYYWQVSGFKKKYGEWSDKWNFKVMMMQPSAPQLLMPENSAENVELKPLFKFSLTPYADSYSLIISTNSDLTQPILIKTIPASENKDTFRLEEELMPNTVYYWGMFASNEEGESPLSPIWKFTTQNSTSVNDDFTTEKIVIFPNPTNDKLQFIAPQGKDIANIEIYNCIGIYIDILLFNGSNLVLDLSYYPHGVYYFYAKDKNGIIISSGIFIKN